MNHNEPGFWPRACGWLLIGCGAVSALCSYLLAEGGSGLNWSLYGGSVLMMWAGVICELNGRRQQAAAVGGAK